MSNETAVTISQLLIALAIVLGALGGFGNSYFGQQIQKEKEAIAETKENEKIAKEATSGVLKPETKVLSSDQSKNFSEFEISDTGTTFQYTGNQDIPMIKFAEDNELKITNDETGVKVSISIRDKNGEVVAELINNEWKVKSNKLWDRNYTKDALEVKDITGDIVLQVRIVNNRPQLQFKVYNSSGERVGVGKIKENNVWVPIMEFTGDKRPNLELKIEPIFKYPSDLHLGELINK